MNAVRLAVATAALAAGLAAPAHADGVDPTVCPILAANPGWYGPYSYDPSTGQYSYVAGVVVDSQGDVYIVTDGTPSQEDKIWDCPPYDA